MPISSDNLPHHIAVIMDGNGRWAKKRFLPRKFGHSRGVESLRKCITEAARLNIKILSVFAFSSENWHRTDEEINAIMQLLLTSLPKEIPTFIAKGVRLKFVGSQQGLMDNVLVQMQQTENQTANGDKLLLNICFNYGGKWDIVNAAQQLQQQQIAITEESLAQRLSLRDCPDPDLLIRTGGEQRISNFLLWQLAYAELFFSAKLWPDFSAADLQQAIIWYQQRERRFGKSSEQL